MPAKTVLSSILIILGLTACCEAGILKGYRIHLDGGLTIPGNFNNSTVKWQTGPTYLIGISRGVSNRWELMLKTEYHKHTHEQQFYESSDAKRSIRLFGISAHYFDKIEKPVNIIGILGTGIARVKEFTYDVTNFAYVECGLGAEYKISSVFSVIFRTNLALFLSSDMGQICLPVTIGIAF